MSAKTRQTKGTTKAAVACGAAVALAALGYGALQGWGVPRLRANSPTAEASAARGVPRVAWAKGVRHVYDARWVAESRSALPGVAAPIEGSGRIEGELSLGALGEVEGRPLLAARLDHVREHALRVMGTDALPTDEETARTFEGREVFVSVAADGTFDTYYFAKGAPKTFEHVMNTLLSQMQVETTGDDRAAWVGHESNANGASTVSYEVASIDPPAVTKRRTRYDALFALPACDGCEQLLDDRGAVAIDRDGALRGVDDDESLTVTRAGSAALASKSAFHAKWLRDEPFAAPTTVTLDPSALDARRPGRFEAPETTAQVSPKIDRDDMLQGIRFYDATKRIDPSFVAHAKELVVARPELCADLADVVADRATGAGGRALALDVLASAETGAAQAAMRRALGSPAARSEPSAYVMLLQRFAVLDRPQPESARFVADVFETARARGDRETRDAAAFTLGSMSRALARGDDRPLARSYDAKLRRDLDEATTPRDRAVYLTALGNAADPGDVGAIRAYAGSDAPEVRAAAANALRSATTHDARETVLDLVADGDPSVQTIALAALDAQPISASDFTTVTAQVTSGNVAPSNEAGLVTFVAKHAQTSPGEARDALLALLASAQLRGDRLLVARIKTLLAAV